MISRIRRILRKRQRVFPGRLRLALPTGTQPAAYAGKKRGPSVIRCPAVRQLPEAKRRLPAVTQEQLDALDYDADLAKAMENSYSIWSQEQAVEDASDDYADNVTDNLHAYNAAQIQLDAEKENVKASFREQYKDIREKQAALTAAQANLEQAQKTFAVQQVQYDRGMISRMEYRNAQDTLAAAEESAASAQIDLFTSYNTYQWAKRGVTVSTAQ